jgi:hypothetical protein
LWLIVWFVLISPALGAEPPVLFVNNRPEGNAPGTIEAVAEELL